MADINKVIRVGDTLTNIIDSVTKKSVNYRKVTTWYDGSPMTNEKVDGVLYRKKGSEYFRQVIDKDGELFLEKNTMAQMRALSFTERLFLKAGVYKGVQLNGYYLKGDTPKSIVYYLSTSPGIDDGGSVILSGDVKLEHVFSNDEWVYTGYFGFKDDDDITDRLQSILNKYSKVKLNKGVFLIKSYVESHPSNGNYLIDQGGVYLNSGNKFDLNGATLKAITGNRSQYNVLRVVNKDDVEIFNGKIDGSRDTFLSSEGKVYTDLRVNTNYDLTKSILIGNFGFKVIVGGSTTIRPKLGSTEDGRPIYNGVTINVGENIVVENLTLQYLQRVGELGFGIALQGTRNTKIWDLDIFNCWGDSIDTQPLSPSHYPTPERLHVTDLFIDYVKCHDNRRQGISIESGLNIKITRSKFYNMYGTAPEAGIDIEPWGAPNIVDGVTVEDCDFYNNGAGWIVDSHSEDTVKNISFINCKSYKNFLGFNIERKPKNVLIDNCFISEPTMWGFSFRGVKDVQIRNTIFENLYGRTSEDVGSEAYRTESVLFNNCIFRNSSIEQGALTNNLFMDNCKFYGLQTGRQATILVRGKNAFLQSNHFFNPKCAVKTYNENIQDILDIRNNVFVNPSVTVIDIQSRANISKNSFIFRDLSQVTGTLSLIQQRTGGSYNNISDNEIAVTTNDVGTVNKTIYLLSIGGYNDIYNLYNYYAGNRSFINDVGTIAIKLTVKTVPDNYFDSGGLTNRLRNIYKDESNIVLARTLDSIPKGVKSGDIVRLSSNELCVIITPPVINDAWTVPTLAVVSYLNKQAAAQANISIADLIAITTADATDLPTALILLNELKVKYNLDVALTNAIKASQNTELTNQRTAGQQAP